MIINIESLKASNTLIKRAILTQAEYYPTTHCDERPDNTDISLLVIHNISLPPNQFGGDHIKSFFTGNLDPDLNEFFTEIYKMRVSAHCLIQRSGHIVQFVPFDKRAWHAGVSSFQGKSRCNDFSIGVELEGTDHIAYTDAQYQSLTTLSKALTNQYPMINLSRIVGHNDIAPSRKTDPGISFDWIRYRQLLLCK